MGSKLDIPVKTNGPMKQVTQCDVSKHAERLNRLQAEVVSSLDIEDNQKPSEVNLATGQALVDADKLMALIEDKFKNQLEFEKASGVYNTTLNCIKRGKPVRIKPTLVRIAKGLKVDIDDLVLAKKVK